MRVDLYEKLVRAGATRRDVLKGAASMAALAAASGAGLGALTKPAAAADDLRAKILQIPGVGKGQPTDADFQKVGELCLEATKANVKQGEFAGVELTFMGLNNQNLHNVLFRGFLKPWEAYTGAKINWIDLAQADYNPRLQQAIATNTIDFDIVEMGAPFEGDVCGKGLTSEMPDWVRKQIDMDDLVAYLKPPVGTWNGKQYRVTIDGDTHNFNYRTDVFADSELASAWKADSGDKAGLTEWGVPKTWQQVQAVTKFLKGKKFKGQDVYGYLDAPKPWGGFGFYFLGSRASAYAKHPDDKAWLFDADTMKPRINNPAWVRAIQDVIDALPSEPKDQINADPNTTAFQQFLAGTGSMIPWWGDVGSNVKTNDSSVVGDVTGFSILPGSDDVYNSKTGKWDKLASGPNYAPNCAYLGWGVYVMARVDSDEKKKKAAWSAAAHLGGKDLSLWCAAYPSGFQPYRNSHFNIPEWVAAGYDEGFISSYLKSEGDSYNHPNAAIEPRIPGIFQYYSAAEDILANTFAGKMKAQEGADAIAAAWEKLTDQIGREKQIKLYKAALGM
ncbi:sugar ABC transporter substrate-binding protein [Mesorhizobium sp. M2D.F.Ca.ET.185.01.1.1]|uniref:ABC transporter substrate-binding protein n=1 Tax=unclassified Mesorhizobium TaxID=325217 RepID=UPI000FCC17B2|nr:MULTISPECIES: sugar ABC transporter substrate-binding protein [unclassified Mesorhizobium]TGP53002.1 sugar ABC transporter substrate-binding protein [bacterium M00.F.Ca.ET.230.01.1.1]TGP80719.1 sugar ABC transporter substrate-binding protein [bacterium M00.F.Ca.ET.227.01.1.1]TGP90503.1 sugar ABC transporter substrate-binding protein [bacterium M00.F.Ca.ET.221.01.1.1]TGP97183.1 sugar ABC transporter substrate-binding protein [bacterium M00.F.Ca.ET.222.01.1.1]TGU12214.1 sugar ABC transporter 